MLARRLRPLRLSPSRPVPAALAALAVFAAAACDAGAPRDGPRATPPAPSPQAVQAGPQAAVLGAEEKVYAVGELASARDYTLSVESVQVCPMTAPFAPAAGKHKLGVALVLEGTTDREVPANPFYATLKDDRGEEHQATLAGCTPALPAVRVQKGKTARGFVTFEVPQTAKKLVLSYAPVLIGGGREVVRFELGQ